jgi:hypothetical protein
LGVEWGLKIMEGESDHPLTAVEVFIIYHCHSPSRAVPALPVWSLLCSPWLRSPHVSEGLECKQGLGHRVCDSHIGLHVAFQVGVPAAARSLLSRVTRMYHPTLLSTHVVKTICFFRLLLMLSDRIYGLDLQFFIYMRTPIVCLFVLF